MKHTLKTGLLISLLTLPLSFGAGDVPEHDVNPGRAATLEVFNSEDIMPNILRLTDAETMRALTSLNTNVRSVGRSAQKAMRQIEEEGPNSFYNRVLLGTLTNSDRENLAHLGHGGTLSQGELIYNLLSDERLNIRFLISSDVDEVVGDLTNCSSYQTESAIDICLRIASSPDVPLEGRFRAACVLATKELNQKDLAMAIYREIKDDVSLYKGFRSRASVKLEILEQTSDNELPSMYSIPRADF